MSQRYSHKQRIGQRRKGECECRTPIKLGVIVHEVEQELILSKFAATDYLSNQIHKLCKSCVTEELSKGKLVEVV